MTTTNAISKNCTGLPAMHKTPNTNEGLRTSNVMKSRKTSKCMGNSSVVDDGVPASSAFDVLP